MEEITILERKTINKLVVSIEIEQIGATVSKMADSCFYRHKGVQRLLFHCSFFCRLLGEGGGVVGFWI